MHSHNGYSKLSTYIVPPGEHYWSYQNINSTITKTIINRIDVKALKINESE